jgi:archaellum component FlaC
MKTLFFKRLQPYFFVALLILFFSNCSDSTQRATGNFDTEKSELSAKIDSRIENLNNDLARLRERANEAGEDVRATFRVQLNELEEERQRLLSQKENVENATEMNWNETRIEIDQALEEIEKSIDQEVERIESEFKD